MTPILIGSRYFFNHYEDFTSKDIDELQIISTDEFAQMRQISGKGRCLFQMKRHETTQEYIDWALTQELGMVVGKFLIPEFNEAIGFTIDDLPKMQPLINKLDEKHLYEKIIYDSYIANNNFILTDLQRDAAYNLYKNTRA